MFRLSLKHALNTVSRREDRNGIADEPLDVAADDTVDDTVDDIVDDIVDDTVGRLLDLLGIDNEVCKRWNGMT